MTNYKICVIKFKSKAAFAKIKPVNPPNTKHEIKVPIKTNVQSLKLISVKARDQANILTAVGTSITKVAHEK